MSLSIIYQLIQTPRGFYLYDRSINTIVSVSESEFNELKNICDNVQVDNSPVVKRLRQKGLLKANDVKIIKHPYTSALPHFSSRCLSSLVLQVTQQCNLRCSYCAFSGLYHNRTHNSERMNFETARKAIDFFIERSFESESLHLGFYGGEPLLEIELIKKCVDYIQKNVEGKRITFGITTNGTLLTGEVLQFLYDNDFSITISLDGPKEDHDACRKFANGKGSFDIVVKNISEAKRLYHYVD